MLNAVMGVSLLVHFEKEDPLKLLLKGFFYSFISSLSIPSSSGLSVATSSGRPRKFVLGKPKSNNFV